MGIDAPRIRKNDVKDQGVVYVVDDDDAVRRSLTRLLASVGLEVLNFAAPAEFLDHRRPDRPSCLVLDLRMPGTTGLALQAALTQKGDELPIIFLTGHADVATTVQAMKAGAVDLLEKPFHDQALLDTVNRALARDQDQRGKRAERARIEQRVGTLTRREREVLALVAAGLPNKLVADRLGASEKTIKVHRARVMAKMEADSLAHLVRMVESAAIGPAPAGVTRPRA